MAADLSTNSAMAVRTQQSGGPASFVPARPCRTLDHSGVERSDAGRPGHGPLFLQSAIYLAAILPDPVLHTDARYQSALGNRCGTRLSLDRSRVVVPGRFGLCVSR